MGRKIGSERNAHQSKWQVGKGDNERAPTSELPKNDGPPARLDRAIHRELCGLWCKQRFTVQVHWRIGRKTTPNVREPGGIHYIHLFQQRPEEYCSLLHVVSADVFPCLLQEDFQDVQNDIAEALLGLFVPWERLTPLFAENASDVTVFKDPRDACASIWDLLPILRGPPAAPDLAVSGRGEGFWSCLFISIYLRSPSPPRLLPHRLFNNNA